MLHKKHLYLVALVAVVVTLQHCNAAQKPHILFIVADDLGWADVGFHESDIPTPNIDSLASQGVKLNNYYVQPLCTPSRAALLSGRYPIRYGLQHSVILPEEPAGLNLTEVILPQYLKEAGYVTRMIGKWHVGFFQWAYTPTYRGFESFYGYYNAQEDHFFHNVKTEVAAGTEGYDLRNNTEVDWAANGTYGTYLFTGEAERIISSHNASSPLFLLLTFQNNHVPLQAPAVYMPLCSHINDSQRQIYCAMGAAMDEAIGNVTRALQKAGMWDDTLLIFTTDNGGWPGFGGINWPLRGGKFTLWEGGVRGVSFLYGNILPNKGTQSNALMHITDWLPTLANLVGSTVKSPHTLDGMDMWNAITTNSPSPRTEILLNIDPFDLTAGIRVGDWKLVVGNQLYNDWYPLPNNTNNATLTAPQFNVISLYNVTADPTEHHDLLTEYPEVVKELLEKIDGYEKGSIFPDYKLPDPEANPNNFNGAWTPWRG